MALITTNVDVGPGVTSTGDVVLLDETRQFIVDGGTIINTVVADEGFANVFDAAQRVARS